MININETKLLVTHTGVFHADDVFSTAFIYLCKINTFCTSKEELSPMTTTVVKDTINKSLMNKTQNSLVISRYNPDEVTDYTLPVVLRTTGIRDSESYPEETLIYDIGGGKFDHHQVDAELRPDGSRYAAFGLLFREFGHLLIPDEKSRENFDNWFVKGIDDTDNGVGPNLLSSSISAYMPNWNEWNGPEAVNRAFLEAVLVAVEILSRVILKANATASATAILESSPVIETDGGKILILEKYVPYNGWAFENGFSAAVYPSNRGGYNCCVVSDPKNGNICKFPVEWRGLTDKETFKEMTGIEGITFCHASGFLLATETELEAIKASGYLEPCVYE